MSFFKRKRKKIIKGTTDRPRLSVFKSNLHIYVQLIDDTSGITLASAHTLKWDNGQNILAALEVGRSIAEKAKSLNIVKVVFDRGRYIYGGRIKALADSARQHGLNF